MSPANEDASVAQWYDKGTSLSRTCLSDPPRLFRSDRWFMPCFKNTCYRPSAFPLPCMTKAADSNHIEACLYQTSVCVCVCVASLLFFFLRDFGSPSCYILLDSWFLLSYVLFQCVSPTNHLWELARCIISCFPLYYFSVWYLPFPLANPRLQQKLLILRQQMTHLQKQRPLSLYQCLTERFCLCPWCKTNRSNMIVTAHSEPEVKQYCPPS